MLFGPQISPECLFYLFFLTKSSFLKSMILINFPIWWYWNILILFNISMMLNKCIIQWFLFEVNTRSLNSHNCAKFETLSFVNKTVWKCSVASKTIQNTLTSVIKDEYTLHFLTNSMLKQIWLPVIIIPYFHLKIQPWLLSGPRHWYLKFK